MGELLLASREQGRELAGGISCAMGARPTRLLADHRYILLPSAMEQGGRG
jgi:hypothetical protein